MEHSGNNSAAPYPLRTAVLLGLAAVALRVVVILWRQSGDPLFHQPINDAAIYHEWARALAGGLSFGTDGAPFFLPPLYPYLTGFMFKLGGGGMWPVTILQALFGTGTVLGVHRLGFRLHGPRAGLIAGALALLFGPALWYEGWLLPTTLNLFLMTVILNLLAADLESGGRRTTVVLIALGFALGLAAIGRPQNLLLAAFILIWLAWRGKAAGAVPYRSLGILLAALVLTIAPVTIHNLKVSREPVPVSANGGVNFYVGNHTGADGRFTFPPGFPTYIGQMQEATRQIARNETGRKLTWQQTSSHWFRKGLDDLGKDPVHAVKLGLLKARLLVSYREMENNFVVGWVRDHTGPGRWMIPSLGLLWLLAVPAVIAAVRRRDRNDMVLLIPTITVSLVCLVFWVSTRNRLPLMIPLAIWAGVSLGNIRLWKSPLPLVLTILLAGAVFWPTADREGAAFYYDIGRIQAQQGRTAEARRYFKDALAIEPGFLMALNGMALSYMDEGNPRRAIAMLEEIIRQHPDFALAKQNLQAIRNYQKNQQK